MTIKHALNHLAKEYEKASKKKFIIKPISYALYQTWRWADKLEKSRGDTAE